MNLEDAIRLQNDLLYFHKGDQILESGVTPALEFGNSIGVRRLASKGFGLVISLKRRNQAKQSAAITGVYKRYPNEVVIQQTGRVVLATSRLPRNLSHHRPLKIGSSIGHRHSGVSGRLTCFVKDRPVNGANGGNIYAISCNHILSKHNRLFGDSFDRVVQPSVGDGAISSVDEIGSTAGIIPIGLIKGWRSRWVAPPNNADFGWSVLTEGVGFDSKSLGDARELSGQVADQSAVDELVDVEKGVFRLDRQGKEVSGTIQDTRTFLRFPFGGLGDCQFTNVLVIRGQKGDNKGFADVGCSGSLVYDAEGTAVAVVFAVTNGSSERLTYCYLIEPVLNRLNFELIASR